MRTNLPVTQREYAFPPGRCLVSTTDLQGRIVYCNAAFIEVSGFTREELLGQPHNLIRHPDMPSEAFRDMWATIGSGRPWSGMVKNRRKDGDHYWVLANVTPLVDGGRTVGYLSVRTEPTRAQIDTVQQLYGRLNDEARQGTTRTRLEAGQVPATGLGGRLQRLRRASMTARLGLLAVLCSTAAAAGSWLGLALAGPGWAAGVVSALSAGVSAAVAWAWLHRHVHARLAGITAHANRIAAGNLVEGVPVRHGTGFGHLELALNQLVVNVKAVVADARDEVRGLRNVAAELAAGNQDLSARTESQASSLQQTAASMEQITGTVRQSAESARGAAEFVQRVTAVSQRSTDTVGDVHATMASIEQASKRIRDIIQVIDSIAFQTNILALNAAVEAASAGEQGRGFAVVAAEVRALSQRTATAAREVRQLIDDSTAQVEVGTAQAEQARRTIAEASEAVHQVSQLVEQIHHGSAEQLTGISQVNEAVTQMDSLTQHNAALVEQLAAAAASLSTQAQAVSHSMDVFRVDRSGNLPDAVDLRKRMKAARAA